MQQTLKRSLARDEPCSGCPRRLAPDELRGWARICGGAVDSQADKLHNLLAVLDVGVRLHQLCEGNGVCEGELRIGTIATPVGPACENLDVTVPQWPGPLEREGASPRSRWLGELRSVAAA